MLGTSLTFGVVGIALFLWGVYLGKDSSADSNDGVASLISACIGAVSFLLALLFLVLHYIIGWLRL